MKLGRAATFGKPAAQFLAGCVRGIYKRFTNEAARRARRRQFARSRSGSGSKSSSTTPSCYFMVDPAGEPRNVNTFGAAQLGYTATELIGRSVLDVFRGRPRLRPRMCRAVSRDRRSVTHLGNPRSSAKDGSVLWVRENAKTMLRA